MAFLKQQELQLEPWRGLAARSAAQQFPTRDDAQRIAIEALPCLAVSALFTCLEGEPLLTPNMFFANPELSSF